MENKRTKHRLVIILIVILFLMFLLTVGIIWTNQKNKNDGLFGKSYLNNEIIKDKDIIYLKEDGQVVEIDGLTVTLEKYIFDADVNRGRCLISVINNGGNVEDIFCRQNEDTIEFGDIEEQEEIVKQYATSERNSIIEYHYQDQCVQFYAGFVHNPKPGTGGILGIQDCKMSVIDDKLYVYFGFYIDINGFEDMIAIRSIEESPTMDFSNKGFGTFKLEDNMTWREFTDGENKIAVSNYSVEINDGQETDISDFVIHMKDGTKHTIEEGDMREVKFEYKTEKTQLRFEESIDIDKISYIMWNGEKIEG